MGKGIALQFKKSFPAMFRAYEKEAKSGRIVPGKMYIFETDCADYAKFIINFPTKRHRRDNSLLEDIDAGLVDLVAQVKRLQIRSIPIPPLGSGNGGLDWNIVRPKITAAFAETPEVEVLLYEPF
jgi:O-acetyl-ADP-ribose deacetylase (regulator of RNase III)